MKRLGSDGGCARDYSELLRLPPPWRAIDKARFFLEAADRHDITTLEARREAHYYLDAALGALHELPQIIAMHYKSLPGWRAWWNAEVKQALELDTLWQFFRKARNEAVHGELQRSRTHAQFARGGGLDYGELHFLEADFNRRSAVELIAEQLHVLESLLSRIEHWRVGLAADPSARPPAGLS